MTEQRLTPEGAKNLMDQIDTLWIQPELRKRYPDGIPADFKIHRCLVRMPRDKPPIVEFNDEIKLIATVTSSTSVTKGDPIYLHQIKEIKAVQQPEWDGRLVAYVLLFWTGNCYTITFNFKPNHQSDELHSSANDSTEAVDSLITDTLKTWMMNSTLVMEESAANALRDIGLWAAPALLPYPLAEIIRLLMENNEPGAARQLLVQHCTPSFLDGLIQNWWSVVPFAERKVMLEQAAKAHREQQYTLSISTLLPQIEGVITDWLYHRYPTEDIPWRQESKTKKFRDLIFADLPSGIAYDRIVKSATDFILEGPVCATFTGWVASIDAIFPNRNVVAHGKHDASLYTEENSTKLILLLDTISQVISRVPS